MDLVVAELPNRRGVAQYHLGGGTPTYFSPAQLETLVEAFQERFELLPGAELAIEVDPRITTLAHIDALAAKGFNRISMGVQDFTTEVQEAVNRVQTPEQMRRGQDSERSPFDRHLSLRQLHVSG